MAKRRKVLTKNVLAFLKRWKKTQGFGLRWRIHSDVNQNYPCCPVSAASKQASGRWLNPSSLRYAHLTQEEAQAIAYAADRPERDPQVSKTIRRALLKGVGL